MSEAKEETFLETLARYQREYNEANPEWFAEWTVRCAAAEQATAKLDELKKASDEATRAMLDAGDNMTDEIWKNFTSTHDAVAEFKAQNPDAGVLLIHPACRELRADMGMGKVRPPKTNKVTEKFIHQLKKGDIVSAHGGKFRVTEDARESNAHRPMVAHLEVAHGPSACAYATAVCIEGEIPGYFKSGSEWGFQGNFNAGKYKVN